MTSQSTNMTDNANEQFQLTLHIIKNENESKTVLHHHQNTCLLNSIAKKHFILTLPDIVETSFEDSHPDNRSQSAYIPDAPSNQVDENRNYSSKVSSFRSSTLLNKQIRRIYTDHLKVPHVCLPSVYDGFDVNFLHYGSENARQFRDIFLHKFGKCPNAHDKSHDFLNSNFGEETSIFHLFVKDLFDHVDNIRKHVANKQITLHLEVLLLLDDKWIDLLSQQSGNVKLRIINNRKIQLDNTTKIEITSQKSLFRVLYRALGQPNIDSKLAEGTFILRIHYEATEFSFQDGNDENIELEELNDCIDAMPVLNQWINEIERYGVHWISRRKDQARFSHGRVMEDRFSEWNSEEESAMTLSSSITKSTISFIDLPFTQSSFEKSYRKDWASLAQQQQKHNITANGRSNAIISLQQIVKALHQKSKFVPYRDSQLSRFLLPVIGGPSITKLLCSVLDRKDSIQDTHNTLLFCQQAKSIVNQRGQRRRSMKKEQKVDEILRILGKFQDSKMNSEDSLFESSHYSPARDTMELANKIQQISPIPVERASPFRNLNQGASSARTSVSKKSDIQPKSHSARSTMIENISQSPNRRKKAMTPREKQGTEYFNPHELHHMDNSNINDERPFIKTVQQRDAKMPFKKRHHEQENVKDKRQFQSESNQNEKQQTILINTPQGAESNKKMLKEVESLMNENSALHSQVRTLSEEQIVMQAKLRAQNNLLATYQIKNRDLQIELDRKNLAIIQLQEKVDIIQDLQQKLLSSISYQDEFNALKQQNKLLKQEINAISSRLLAQEARTEAESANTKASLKQISHPIKSKGKKTSAKIWMK